MNSNTLNVLAGVCLPGLALGFGAATHQTALSVWWLMGMTLIVIAFAALRSGFSRWHGIVVIGLYGAFIAVSVAG